MDFNLKERETGRVEGGGKPTFRDYTRMLADRPPKFSAGQVDYREAEGREACKRCVHFYVSDAADRSVCEIFRPGGDENVNPDWVCNWFSDDGVRFPLRRDNE